LGRRHRKIINKIAKKTKRLRNNDPTIKHGVIPYVLTKGRISHATVLISGYTLSKSYIFPQGDNTV
jgi:hypothetical protein